MTEKEIKTTSEKSIPVDGNLQTMLQLLYKSISLDNKMVYTTEQLAEEMKNIVKQLNEQERAHYLVQSLIVNFKFYEREMIKEVYEKAKKSKSN